MKRQNRFFKLSATEQPLVADKLKQAEWLWMQKSGLGLLSSIVLLGTMPQLMNIHLTKRRVQRDVAMKQAAHRYGMPLKATYNQTGSKLPVAWAFSNGSSSGLGRVGSVFLPMARSETSHYPGNPCR